MIPTLTVQGVKVPQVGLGTWRLAGKACIDAVRHALEFGYRHIDTARVYANEREIALGLAFSRVDRGDVFLTTKVWREDLAPDRLRASAEESLRQLATDYVDLLLIHWPSSAVGLESSLEAMLALKEEGKIRQLGVSNFPPRLLECALAAAPVLCDQVEYHPYLPQPELLALAGEHDLLLMAHSPMADGRVPREPVLAEIGRDHGKSAAQIALRWLVQQNVGVLIKSADPGRRASNIDIFDFELTAAECARVAGLADGSRLHNPP